MGRTKASKTEVGPMFTSLIRLVLISGCCGYLVWWYGATWRVMTDSWALLVLRCVRQGMQTERSPAYKGTNCLFGCFIPENMWKSWLKESNLYFLWCYSWMERGQKPFPWLVLRRALPAWTEQRPDDTAHSWHCCWSAANERIGEDCKPHQARL